jgi:hypothetical protein
VGGSKENAAFSEGRIYFYFLKENRQRLFYFNLARIYDELFP